MKDAGVHPSDHYRANMTATRFKWRSYVLHMVRNETGILASLQGRFRTPILDQYFALTANLGTHLFYMMFLPLFFWCAAPDLGRDVIWGLAIGVSITGIIKDWLCLPRPLSPPVHRISMSGSACLEYGFPSTHSCNALTVALVVLDHFGSDYIWVILWLVMTIVVGRLYSGMHGMLDVAFGSFLGVLTYLFRVSTKHLVDSLFAYHIIPSAVVGMALILVTISLHPQPVDDCPCFDDTVAFLAVLWGVETFGGAWYMFNTSSPLQPPINVLFTVLRFLIGVSIIVVWRIIAKKTMLTVLSPVLRWLAKLGILLPRQYYTPANMYDQPPDVPGETIIDSPKQFKETVSNIRRTRGRSDSVGPQSQHDYYEALSAYEQDKTTEKPHLDDVTQPRKRYDVEVITKITVYSGIPLMVFWAANPIYKWLNI